MVSSFYPHSMCEKVERVTAKTGCTSCTNWTISFEVSGFRTKKHICYKHTSFFLIYYNSGLFLFSVCTIQGNVIDFQPFPTSFVIFMHLLIILSYKTLKLKSTTKWTLKRLKPGMVSSFHPHSMCKKVERLTAKTGYTSCIKCTIQSYIINLVHIALMDR